MTTTKNKNFKLQKKLATIHFDVSVDVFDRKELVEFRKIEKRYRRSGVRIYFT